jgi:hypothetical protein
VDTAEKAKLANGTVMLVINKKVDKEKKATESQNSSNKVPTTLNTGMGSSSPVGFGAYGLINHPEYMSAISSAVSE